MHRHAKSSTFLVLSCVILLHIATCQSFLPTFEHEAATQQIENVISKIGAVLNNVRPIQSSVQELLDYIEANLTESVWQFGNSSKIDPDTFKTPEELIASQGYQVEVHQILTEDNYTLTAWRIYSNATRKANPVLITHGFFDSAFTWILNDGNQSLAYGLADLGYEVWLANNRGNRYSHDGANEDNYDTYWNFSWDEFAKYDLPAHIAYVLNISGADKLHYMGHSDGTTQMFAALTLNPSIQDNLRTFVGFGPTVFEDFLENSVIKFLFETGLMNAIFEGIQKLNYHRVWVDSAPVSPTLGYVCNQVPTVCANIVESIVGKPNKTHYNLTRMAVMASHEPAGSSLQNLYHEIQGMNDKNFQMFDFGSAQENVLHYGTPTPSLYNYSNWAQFTIPGLLVHGSVDALSLQQDIDETLSYFPEGAFQVLEIPDYGHLDYIWSDTAYIDVYPYVFEFIGLHENDA